VTGLCVTVAAYGTFEAATADWDDIDRCPVNHSNTIDAVLVEREEDRVASLHRFSMQGWGYGWIASAVVGVLWPPALLAGAVAGGVGANVITCVSRGLSREDVSELGRVLASGPFVSVVVTDMTSNTSSTLPVGSRALRMARLPMGGSTYQLREALEVDVDET
jgi:hypothetical protein